MPRRLLTTVAVVIALGLAYAGCGASDDGAADAGAAKAGQELSPEERYAQRATEVCRGERRAIVAELAERRATDNPQGEDGVGHAAKELEEVVLPGFRRQYEGLRRLWPPRGSEDFLDLMLSKWSRALENGEEDLDRFFRLKLSRYSEFAEGTLMTEEFGIKGCGSRGRSPEAVYRAF